jgi:hypothetical protein
MQKRTQTLDVFDDQDVLHFKREDWRYHRDTRRKEYARYLDEVLRSRAYRQLGLSWEDFCRCYLGINAARAYLLIHERKGTWRGSAGPISNDNYPSLTRFARQGAVWFDGVRVAVTPDNREIIRRVIHLMHERFLAARRTWRERQRVGAHTPSQTLRVFEDATRETGHSTIASFE